MCRAEDDVQQKQYEKLLVPNSDAIIHPGAVVVHLDNAAPTLTAVMSARGLESAAFSTNFHVLVHLN